MFIIFGGFVPMLIFSLAMAFWPVTIAIGAFCLAANWFDKEPRIVGAIVILIIVAFVGEIWFPGSSHTDHIGWIVDPVTMQEHPPAH